MSAENTDQGEGRELRFIYQKSNLFRVIHVDGAFGGVSPNPNLVQLAVFNERHPIPKVTVHHLESGSIGKELREKREAKDGIIREVETAFIMEVSIAKRLILLLLEQVQKAEQIQKEASEASSGDNKKEEEHGSGGQAILP